jgi:hypothetical protein
MPSRFSAPLPAPTLNSADPDRPKTVVILRSGMRLPVGDAVAWRALSKQATQVLGQALDNSLITEAGGAWCAELSLSTPGPSRLAGHHRARWLRLVRSALADRHLVEVVTGLRDRFDAGSYIALTEVMNSHEIGRGRGGTTPALRRMRVCPTIVGVGFDRLDPLHQQAGLADLLGVDLQVIRSPRGHDGFLVETDQINAVLADALT